MAAAGLTPIALGHISNLAIPNGRFSALPAERESIQVPRAAPEDHSGCPSGTALGS